MGCASSTSTDTQHKVVISATAPNQYPVGQTAVVQNAGVQNVSTYSSTTHTVKVSNLPDAPKHNGRKDSSSSSSSSDSESTVDLNKKRKEIKERSQKAALKKQKAVLSTETIQRYNALAIVISKLERKNVTLKLEEKVRLSAVLKQQALKMNEEYKQLQIKTNKEYQDVQNLQNLAVGTNVFKYFQSQSQFDTQMSKEQEEYLQAKTEMEDCYKRIVALQSRQSALESEIASLNLDQQELHKHYKEQDEILDSIFDGAYGSELEDKLEDELDKQLERKQRIEVAYQKWRHADNYVQAASRQLNYAYDRWQSIQRISFHNFQNRMLIIQVAGQARSYLIAASQNLSASHRVLDHVKFPYCTKEEIMTLNKAISYIFIDAQTKARHGHAGEVYRTTRDRCYVLSQWTNHVITKVVQKDLEASRAQCADLSNKLRAERSRLMREKIEEETGEKVLLDEPDSGIETDDDEPSSMAAAAEDVAEDQNLDEKIKEAEKDPDGEEDATAGDSSKPAPLPLDELAPAPEKEELFGNLDAVMTEYEKQKNEYAKEMEANRARQTADFQMKLQARRSRKKRMMAQQQELDEMMKKEQEIAAIEVPKEA